MLLYIYQQIYAFILDLYILNFDYFGELNANLRLKVHVLWGGGMVLKVY